MRQACAARSDPQTAVAAPKQPAGGEAHIARERIGFDPALHDLADSAPHGDQKRVLIALRETLNTVKLAWHRIESGRTGLPMPQPVCHLCPETSLPVLVQSEH